MMTFSTDTLQFISKHRKDDVRALALQASKYPQVDMAEAVIQIAGWQIAEKKIPSWAEVEGICYPKHLSLEQCSSEITARYKASLVSGDSFVDLTSGLGVDCSFIARNFRQVDYVERQEQLCQLAEHNFPLLGLGDVRIHCTDGVEYLKRMSPVDCIYLDPARRDNNGGKTVAIAECEPDLCVLEQLLVEKGRIVMVKLSPMLDIFSALRELKYVRQVHIISVNNECKELIMLLQKTYDKEKCIVNEAIISCEQIVNNSNVQHFDFTYSEEKSAVCNMADGVGTYLYEPGAALMKAGAYRSLAQRYEVRKLHVNSHLYTSDKLMDFPGRKFKVTGVSGFGKQELKSFLQHIDKANLTVRNFPSSVSDLRKRLKLKEGGDVYLFATTLSGDEKVLVKCMKVGS